MTEVICQDNQGTIWNVPSFSSDETYVCAVDKNGELFCSCPDFTFRKASQHPHLGDVNNYCKHLKEVLESENSCPKSHG